MTFNDLQRLMAENIENFSDGKKPTFGNWLMFAQAYSAALAPPLDEDYANSCLSAAGIKRGAIISAELLDKLFTNLYSQSYHINTIHDFLSTNGFANGDKPTGAQFRQLNSHAFLHASQTQIRVVIDSKRISGYNTNSSAGIDFKTYEDSYAICNPSQQVGYLSNYANAVSTAYINMTNTVPIILSPYIGIQLFGCTFTNANINITVVDDNLGTEIGSMQTILQSNTTVAGISTDIMMLSQSTLNRLTFMLA
jgi:hypothetical protein